MSSSTVPASGAPAWARHFWRNTASSYLRVVLRLATGLVLFRLLYGGLSPAEFGYWSLLWSVFGYGVLLDFGLGFTVQRAVARTPIETSAGDGTTTASPIAELNHLLTTVFWTFAGLGTLMAGALLALGPWFLGAVDTPPEMQAPFGLAWWCFAIGLGLNLPLGVFPEVLRGRQRLDLVNGLQTVGVLANFGLLLLALDQRWGMPALVAISLATTIFPNLAAAFLAYRLVPGLSLHPRGFQFRAVRAALGFSLAAYLITFSNLLMARSDQLVIGLVLGVAAVAVYQAGYKMGEMLNLFTLQLQEALSPAAASLHAGGDREGLRELLRYSTRLTVLLTTPLYLLSAAYLTPLISLLTGLDVVPAEAWWTGQTLLLSIYSSQLTNSCTKRVLMMCGHERTLLKLSVFDAVANVGLSVVLAYGLGVTGVALGTLVPTVVVGWVLVLPLALRFVELDPRAFAKAVLWPVAPAVGASAVLIGLQLWLLPPSLSAPLWDLAWRGLVALAPVAWLGRRWLRPPGGKR